MHYHKGFWSSQEKELKILQIFLCCLSKSPHSIEQIIKEVEQILFTRQERKNAPLNDTGICLTNSGQELWNQERNPLFHLVNFHNNSIKG